MGCCIARIGRPNGLTVDEDIPHRLCCYVACGNGKVSVHLVETGRLLREWTCATSCHDLAIAADEVFVTCDVERVLVFSKAGRPRRTWPSEVVSKPVGIAEHGGLLYVSELLGQLKVFTPSAELIYAVPLPGAVQLAGVCVTADHVFVCDSGEPLVLSDASSFATQGSGSCVHVVERIVSIEQARLESQHEVMSSKQHHAPEKQTKMGTPSA